MSIDSQLKNYRKGKMNRGSVWSRADAYKASWEDEEEERKKAEQKAWEEAAKQEAEYSAKKRQRDIQDELAAFRRNVENGADFNEEFAKLPDRSKGYVKLGASDLTKLDDSLLSNEELQQKAAAKLKQTGGSFEERNSRIEPLYEYDLLDKSDEIAKNKLKEDARKYYKSVYNSGEGFGEGAPRGATPAGYRTYQLDQYVAELPRLAEANAKRGNVFTQSDALAYMDKYGVDAFWREYDRRAQKWAENSERNAAGLEAREREMGREAVKKEAKSAPMRDETQKALESLDGYDWRSLWVYDEFDPGDRLRKANGEMPEAVRKKYDFSDPADVALYDAGLPPKSMLKTAQKEAENKRQDAIKEQEKANKEAVRENSRKMDAAEKALLGQIRQSSRQGEARAMLDALLAEADVNGGDIYAAADTIKANPFWAESAGLLKDGYDPSQDEYATGDDLLAYNKHMLGVKQDGAQPYIYLDTLAEQYATGRKGGRQEEPEQPGQDVEPAATAGVSGPGEAPGVMDSFRELGNQTLAQLGLKELTPEQAYQAQIDEQLAPPTIKEDLVAEFGLSPVTLAGNNANAPDVSGGMYGGNAHQPERMSEGGSLKERQTNPPAGVNRLRSGSEQSERASQTNNNTDITRPSVPGVGGPYKPCDDLILEVAQVTKPSREQEQAVRKMESWLQNVSMGLWQDEDGSVRPSTKEEQATAKRYLEQTARLPSRNKFAQALDGVVNNVRNASPLAVELVGNFFNNLWKNVTDKDVLQSGVELLEGDITADEYRAGLHDTPVGEESEAYRGVAIANAQKANALEGLTGVPRFLAEAGLSIADNAVTIGVSGPLTPVVMGASAMGNEGFEIGEKGGTGSQQFAGGALAGIAETAGETFSFGKLRAIAEGPLLTGVNAIKQIAAQAGVEFTEEAATEVMNIASDALVMGDQSDFEQAKAARKREGMDDFRATLATLGDMALRTGKAGAMGALVGAARGTGARAFKALGGTTRNEAGGPGAKPPEGLFPQEYQPTQDDRVIDAVRAEKLAGDIAAKSAEVDGAKERYEEKSRYWAGREQAEASVLEAAKRQAALLYEDGDAQGAAKALGRAADAKQKLNNTLDAKANELSQLQTGIENAQKNLDAGVEEASRNVRAHEEAKREEGLRQKVAKALTPNVGKTGRMKTQKGESLEFVYAIVDASQLKPSDIAVTSVSAIPVVSMDGTVESGNTQVALMLKSYEDKTKAKRILKNLTSISKMYALDLSNLPNNPVVVRVRTSDIDTSQYIVPQQIMEFVIPGRAYDEDAAFEIVKQEYLNAVDPVVRTAAEKVRNGEKIGSITLSEATEREGTLMQQLTGIHTLGFKHKLVNDSFVHVDNEHGPFGSADQSMADLDDIARIKYVIDNFDSISLVLDKKGLPKVTAAARDRNMAKAPMVMYSKRIDGMYYVVEAIPDTNAKEMLIISAYKNPKIEGAVKAPNEGLPQVLDANAPEVYVQNAAEDKPLSDEFQVPYANAQQPYVQNVLESSSDINNVSQKGENVKGDGVGAKYAMGEATPDELIEEYGALPRGESPARDIEIPAADKYGGRTGAFARTAAEAAGLSDEIAGAIRQETAEGSFAGVDSVTNAEAVEKANAKLEAEGYEAALRDVEEKLNRADGRFDKNDATLAMRMVQEAAKKGDGETAMRLLIKLAGAESQAGQTLQAASVFKRLSPEGQLVALQRQADELAGKHIPRAALRRMEAIEKQLAADKGAIKAYERLTAKYDELAKNYDPVVAESNLAELNRIRGELRNFRDNAKQLKTAQARLDALTEGFDPVKAEAALDELNRLRGEMGNFRDNSGELAKAQARYDALAKDFDPVLAEANLAETERIRGEIKNLNDNQKALERLQARYDELNRLTNPVELRRQVDEAREKAQAAKARRDEALRAQKELDGLRQRYAVELDPALAAEYLAAGDEAARKAAMGRLAADVAAKLPSTWADKVNALRYTAMLSGVNTHWRNIVGNAAQLTLKKARDALGAGVEAGLNKAGLMDGRTKAIVGRDDPLREFANSYWEANKDSLVSENRFMQSAIEQAKKVFKTAPLEKARTLVSDLLEREDRLFFGKAFRDSLAGYLKANGITAGPDGKVRADEALLDSAREYAAQEALKATFRDDSKLASAINSIEHRNNVAKLLVGGLLPFKKTPINIVKRGVEYSPAGLAIGIGEFVSDIRSTGKVSAKAVDRLCAGLTGTSIALLGYAMAESGLLRATGEDDEKKNAYEKQLGRQDYAIVPGGRSYTLTPLSTAAIPLFMGAEIKELAENEGLSFEDVADGMARMFDPLTEMTMLSSVDDAIRSIAYGGDNAVSAALVTAGTDYLRQFSPALLRGAAQTLDPARRSTYIPRRSTLSGKLRAAGMSIQSGIPGLRNGLEPSVDVWGRDMDAAYVGANNPIGRAAANFASPGYYAEWKPEPLDEEILRVYGETGDSAALPAGANATPTIDGGKLYMEPEEKTRADRTKGRIQKQICDELIASPVYKQLTDEQKAKALGYAYEYAGEAARAEFAANRGLDYRSGNAKLDEGLKDAPMTAGEWFAVKSAASQIESDKDRRGNTVEGSRKRNIQKWLRDAGVSSEKYRWVMKQLGYK